MWALGLLCDSIHAFFLNQSDAYKATTALAKLEMNMGNDIFEAKSFKWSRWLLLRNKLFLKNICFSSLYILGKW